MTVASAPRVTLFDGFSLRFGEGASRRLLEELPHGVQRLVAHVCLSGRAPRAAIAGHLWPDVPEDHAHGSLRSALWRLHKAAPGLMEVCGDALRLAEGVRVDVRELGAWARRVHDPKSCLADVEVPDVGLSGELLPGWYDDWVLLERERLRQLRMHALEQAAIRLVAAGRPGDALQAAYAAVHAEPLRESAHRTVVGVHLAEGNVVEALRAYDSFRVMITEELGVQPSEQMARLIRSLYTQRNGSCGARASRDALSSHSVGTAAKLG
ncbi:BTAD domain-containing putative transcriptional regulator [Blastococcus sp. BMG 814]|uniref:BTAD domain-containing putative transcriptional regulator n=1 Tax=Blastococcus carthaginiensis TaxID=3050034 RepID=A0ABT9I7M4_9ACTN|nr:BTAD domain-containing putative transcriptional regulator [Blastococcus carthaginiensis]MDP5181567.1 BTAD domain-containing putative transcriptional regulator [Blastococcus carthaginiensis]